MKNSSYWCHSGAGEVGQAPRIMWHSILRHAESSQGFTEIKQVSGRSIQVCWGINGDQCLEHFVLKLKHPYIVGKSEKSLDIGEPTFHAEKTACYRLHQQTKVHVLALALQTTLENCTKSTRAVLHRISRFHSALHHQIAECTSLSYPPSPDSGACSTIYCVCPIMLTDCIHFCR